MEVCHDAAVSVRTVPQGLQECGRVGVEQLYAAAFDLFQLLPDRRDVAAGILQEMEFPRADHGLNFPAAQNPFVGIGAFIHNWIPESWIASVLGSNNPLGVVLATLIGVPMYADIFGTIPVAEALLAKGALLGSVLAFMMAVTTLSLPSLIMLRKAVKPKLLGLFIGICTISIILVGYLFNLIQFILV